MPKSNHDLTEYFVNGIFDEHLQYILNGSLISIQDVKKPHTMTMLNFIFLVI